MNELRNFLKENPIQYLATVGLDDKAKVRPVQFMVENNNKFYFCTSNEKPVYKELEKSPYLELTVASPEYVWLRIAGKAVFSNDLDIKQEIIDNSELVKSIYETANNPAFEVFSIEGKATIADFSGEAPREFDI
ncbi:MAG: pyridoxamine 5'-phosphate oxidase family protein [Methanobacteriaceae archaeon]